MVQKEFSSDMALDQQDKTFYLGAGWAKEVTLAGLLSQTSKGNQLLANIAKNVSKDDKATTALIKELQILADATEKAAEAAEDTGARQKESADATKDLRRSMGLTAKSFNNIVTMDSKNLFGGIGSYLDTRRYGLATVNPELSALAGTVAIAVEVFDVIWKRGTEMADAIYSAYDSGLVFSGGISQLANDAADTGLDLQTLSKVLTKHGQVVATMGIAKTAALGKAFTAATNGGISMGMNFEQAQDTLLSYTDQLRMTGMLQGRSTAEIVKGAQEYGHELNLISQVTGKRREQIDQEINQARQRPDVNFFVNTLTDELKDSFNKVGLPTLQALGGETSNAFLTLMTASKNGAAGMLAANKNLTMALMQTPGAMEEFNKLQYNIVHGNAKAAKENMKNLNQLSSDYIKQHGQNAVQGTLQYDLNMEMSKIQRDTATIAQGINANADEMPTPDDATRIRDAQQAISGSMNELNQAFNDLASKILVPLAGPFAYLIKSVITFAKGPIFVLTKAFEYLGVAITKVTDFFSYLINLIPGMKTTDDQGNESAGIGSTIVQGTVGAVVTALIAGPLMMKLIRGTLKGLSAGEGLLKSFMGGGGGILSKLGGGAAQAAESAAGAGGGKGFGTFSKIGNFGSSIAKGFAGLTKGIAEVIETVLTSLARGIKAFGDTQVIKGMLSLGILAADIFIAGKAFQQFSTVKWEDMGKAGVAMVALAGAAALVGRDAAMIALGGISLGAAIGAIGLGMMAAGSGLEKFEKISWETMGKAGIAITAIGVASAAAGLAAPLIALGGAALGIAIGAIGAGIAGAAWLMGNTLPTLAEGMERLAKLNGNGMQQAGRGMESIALGLAAMAAGKVTDALGSLGASIINFFTGNDPIKQLLRFGELGEPLSRAGVALKLFADAYPGAVAAINLQINTGGMLSFIDVIGQFDRAIRNSKLDFDINELKRFGELIDPLSRITSIMPPFADAFEYVSKALSLPIATDGMLSLINLITQLDSAIAASSLDFDINELKRFGELVDPLNSSSDAMLKFSDVYAKSFAILNATTFSADALDTLYKLDDIFRYGAFVLMGNWLLGSDAVMIRLANLEPATAYIEDVADRLYYFADAYSYLAEALSVPILNTVFPFGLDSMGFQRATDTPISTSAFTPSTTTAQLQDQTSVNTTTNTTPTKHHHTTQEQRHKEMMDALNTLNDNISSLLDVEDRQTRVMSDGFSKVSGIIH